MSKIEKPWAVIAGDEGRLEVAEILDGPGRKIGWGASAYKIAHAWEYAMADQVMVRFDTKEEAEARIVLAHAEWARHKPMIEAAEKVLDAAVADRDACFAQVIEHGAL